MIDNKLIPVFRGELEKATLIYSYLKGDGLAVKMVADPKSPPLQSPAAHNVKSRYTMHVLLVPEPEAARALELVESFLENDGQATDMAD